MFISTIINIMENLQYMHLIVDVECSELWQALEADDEARDAVLSIGGALVETTRDLQAHCLLRIGWPASTTMTYNNILTTSST